MARIIGLGGAFKCIRSGLRYKLERRFNRPALPNINLNAFWMALMGKQKSKLNRLNCIVQAYGGMAW